MIGNDVVDLRDGDAAPGARHPRFDRRVFTAAERALLASSAAPDLDRWRFWAAKEAAYKVAKKLDPACVFSPIRFEVELDRTGSGHVDHAGRRHPVRVSGSAVVVHAVATDAAISRERLCVGCAELPAEPATDPSRHVRELAVAALRSVWPHAKTLHIGSDRRIPVLDVDDRDADADLSLSHHGRWVAFACELPAAATESA